MGKRHQHDELREYLDYLQEKQEHQYSRGYWLGKVRKDYSGEESKKLMAMFNIFCGAIFLAAVIGFLLRNGFYGWVVFDWRNFGSVLMMGFLFFVGALQIAAGIRGMRGKKKGRKKDISA